MSAVSFLRRFHRASHNAGLTTKVGFGTILREPSILAYPLLASLFVLITYPVVSSLVLDLWHGVEPRTATDLLGATQQQVPHALRDKLGVVSFYFFYTAVVSAYFTCAAAAAVWARLEGHPTSVIHGLAVVARHFIRVSHFALLSIMFIPLSIFAQRRKLKSKKGVFDVIGSSLTMHTANLAPAILTERTTVTQTVRTAVDTLGGAWREGLIIKIMTWTVLLLLGTASFLPYLLQGLWFDKSTSPWVGWFTGSLMLFIIFIVTKVIGGVLLTVLYYQVKHQPEKFN